MKAYLCKATDDGKVELLSAEIASVTDKMIVLHEFLDYRIRWYKGEVFLSPADAIKACIESLRSAREQLYRKLNNYNEQLTQSAQMLCEVEPW